MDNKTDEILILDLLAVQLIDLTLIDNIDLQVVQITRLGVDLLVLDHQVVQTTNLGVDLLTVLVLDPQVEQITHLGVDLLTVLTTEVVLVDIRVLEVENTSNLLEVRCGENHLDQVTEALHSNNIPSLV